MAALLTTAEFIANRWLSSYILDETISNAIAFNDLETLVAVLRHGAKMGAKKMLRTENGLKHCSHPLTRGKQTRAKGSKRQGNLAIKRTESQN